MSLTSILSNPNHRPLREAFTAAFPHPRPILSGELKAPPLTTSWGLVGTAFDYLMRFMLEAWNKDVFKNKHKREWVADDAYSVLCHTLLINTTIDPTGSLFRYGSLNATELLIAVISQYAQAKKDYRNYIASGELTKSLLTSTLFLAKLDAYARAKVIDNNLAAHAADDVQDLANLAALINHERFTAKKHCILNPEFGTATLLAGGADADLIIDGTLIDIKTTKHLKLDRDYLDQVIGYYILSLLNEDQKSKCPPIRALGIYFSRHGVLWTIPVTELGNRTKFKAFAEDFKRRILEKKAVKIITAEELEEDARINELLGIKPKRKF